MRENTNRARVAKSKSIYSRKTRTSKLEQIGDLQHIKKPGQVEKSKQNAKGLADTLLSIANETSLKYARSTNWSMFHLWQHMHQLDQKVSRSKKSRQVCVQRVREEYKRFWSETHPFGTCVDVSWLASRNLVDELAKHETIPIRKYANNVRLLGCYQTVEENGRTWTYPWHCIVAVMLPEYCIVIDVFHNFAAFKVDEDSEYDTMATFDLEGSQYHWKYRYGSSGKQDEDDYGPELSIQAFWSTGETGPLNSFGEITHTNALQKLIFPMARQLTPRDDGMAVPGRKYLTITSLLSEAPEDFPCVEVEDGYLITSCRLSVDFRRCSILMQIPHEDFYYKEENEDLASDLEYLDMVNYVNTSVTNVMLDLTNSDTENLSSCIEAMGDLGEAVGLEKDELLKIIAAVVGTMATDSDISSGFKGQRTRLEEILMGSTN